MEIDIRPAVKRAGIPSISTNQRLTTAEILDGLTLRRDDALFAERLTFSPRPFKVW